MSVIVKEVSNQDNARERRKYIRKAINEERIKTKEVSKCYSLYLHINGALLWSLILGSFVRGGTIVQQI